MMPYSGRCRTPLVLLAVATLTDNTDARATRRRVLAECAEALTAAAETSASPNANLIRQGAARFAEAVATAPDLPVAASLVPVLESRAELGQGPADLPIARSIAAAADLFPWSASSRGTDGGTEIALGLLDQVVDFGTFSLNTSEGSGLIVGLAYVGAHCVYPEHNHAPQELYLVISGQSRWRFGGSAEYVTLAPGDTLYNNPRDIHGLVAGDAPVLALYVLWA